MDALSGSGPEGPTGSLAAARAEPASSKGRALVFIGFMGAGKSTSAREAADRLGVDALDSDRLLEARFGRSISEEFERVGEAAFRASEEALVLELLAGAGRGTVLALGGGSVLSPRVQAALRDHVTILLDVDIDTAWTRATRGSIVRPLARDRGAFERLWDERAPVYERLADTIVPVESGEALRRALPQLVALAEAERPARMLWATAASGDYPVFIGSGLLHGSLWPLDRSVSRGFCVTDETVARLHGSGLEWVAGTIAIPPGERHKSLHSAERVWAALVDARLTRADHVVALGGGVVGDLAGFCAATYQRGVPVVQVPTTLVAQVDSAYGGKTGVDIPGGKNYVGVYHQPAGVIVDPSALDTLPVAERAAGYAEVVKTALIAGGELWARVAAGEPLDERMIVACARTKLAVVAADERDAGARQRLNLGHTIGHAIETATAFSRLRHGEAVGLGLLAALRLSGQPDLRAQVSELLAAEGLPTRMAGLDAAAVLAATASDKKRLDERVPFVLVDAPGRVRTGATVPVAEQLSAIEELIEP